MGDRVHPCFTHIEDPADVLAGRERPAAQHADRRGVDEDGGTVLVRADDPVRRGVEDQSLPETEATHLTGSACARRDLLAQLPVVALDVAAAPHEEDGRGGAEEQGGQRERTHRPVGARVQHAYPHAARLDALRRSSLDSDERADDSPGEGSAAEEPAAVP